MKEKEGDRVSVCDRARGGGVERGWSLFAPFI